MGIFDMDGPVYKIGNEIADALILTLLWFIFSIPIITVGASTSALFYIYGKKARNEDVYVLKDFWKSYKQNFLQSIPITLLLGVMWVSVSTYRLLLMGYGEKAPVLLSGVALFFTVEVTIMTVYGLAVLSRFHMKVLNIFLTAFVLAHRHIKSTILIVGLVIILQYASGIIPLVFFFMPILIIGIASIPLQKIFTQHIEATQNLQKENELLEIDDENLDDSEDEDDTEEDNEDDSENEEDDEEKEKDFLKYI